MGGQLAELTLHWLDRSRAQRIVWLLEECRLQYKIVTYKRQADMQAPPSLKAVHPLGKSPVLEVKVPGNGPSKTMAESGSIVEYIAEHFGRHLIPQQWKAGQEGKVLGETEEWLRYKFYTNYAEGSLMSLAAQSALKDGIKNAPVPFFIKPITRTIAGKIESAFLNHNFESHLSFLESELKSSPPAAESQTVEAPFFCAQHLTAPDFMMIFPLEAAQQWQILTKTKYPLLTDYIARIQGREAYKKAIERIIQETGSYEAGV